jgi:hypothetical protein
VAAAPDGVTQAMAPKKDVALQPAAGFVLLWQAAHLAFRTGATSAS